MGEYLAGADSATVCPHALECVLSIVCAVLESTDLVHRLGAERLRGAHSSRHPGA